MKKIFWILFLTFSIGLVYEAQAQLSRKERKAYRKKARDLRKNPENLKDMMDNKSSLENEVGSLQKKVSSYDERMEQKNARISELENELESVKSEMSARLREANEKLKEKNIADKKDGNWDKGVVFKVQIGAFRNKDLSQYLEGSEMMEGEKMDQEEGMRYTLGNFRDYWEADKFKKYLRAMGVKDAWIVSFSDGQRVPIKDVLEGIQ